LGSGKNNSKIPVLQELTRLVFLIILVYASLVVTSSTIVMGQSSNKVFQQHNFLKPPRPTFVEKKAHAHTFADSELKVSMAGDSLLLSWDPVTVDTAGNEVAISYYEVFRDTIPYFTPSLVNRIATTINTTYLDVTPGLVGDVSVNYFYAVSARDTNGKVSAPSIQVCEYDMILPQGWSIFSLPILPATTELSMLLQDQLTGSETQDESDLIYYFDPITQEFTMAWYNTAIEEWQGSLNELLPQHGYIGYIRPVHASAVVSLLGTLTYDVHSLQIIEGWNLIAYPFAESVQLDSSGLVECGFQGDAKPWQSDRIYAYSDQTYLSAWYKNDSAEWYGTLTELGIGKGFWLLRLPGHGEFQWQCER